MCYHENSGDRWLRGSTWKQQALRAVWLLPLIVAILTIVGCHMQHDPWFGRGKNLPHAPVSVVTGTVDSRVGIRGVLELQMSKTEVEKRLGKPLIEAMSTEEALQQGLDPEDVADYFYSGVFAWVLYDASGRVLSIKFDLENLKKRIEIEQSVLLVISDKPFLASRQTSYEEVVRFMQAVGQSGIEQQPYEIVVRFKDGRVFSLGFNANRRLERITISL